MSVDIQLRMTIYIVYLGGLCEVISWQRWGVN